LKNLYEIKYIPIDINNPIKNMNKNKIELDLKCNYFFMEQLNDFDKFVLEHNYDLKKIKIIMSLIWLNMSPLYDNRLSEFLFYFGKYNLCLIL